MTRAFSRHKDSVRSAREPHPISSHRIRLQNARLADRDARCVRLISPAPGLFRDERGERAVDAATEPRRASRDICDREHARASAQLRGISRGTTCMHVYIYILPVAFPMRRRDAKRRVVQERGPRSPAKDAGPRCGPATCSDSSTMDGNQTRSRIRSPEGQRERRASSAHHERRGFPPGIWRDRAPALALVAAPP